ncbi:MAG: endonuclease domain-containing protein [Clostridia bacterium]|nr:endonuclease domain-containing protein [Clostridia bacterium]MBR5714460.1 endonuclease domain-containing protein [Clostridia bacterium]
MQYKGNPQLVPFAGVLRKNMTRQEKKLWYRFLSKYPVRFYRQKVLGKYIADFYCAKASLVIELDGSQHYKYRELEHDAERTLFLEDYGLSVIRISNYEVDSNFEGVCLYIDNIVKGRCGLNRE